MQCTIARDLGFEVRVEDLRRGVDGRRRLLGARWTTEVASGQARVRHRFTIAHELGHATFGHRHGETEVAEQEANAFAGALLVPPSWLRHDIKTSPKIEALTRRYDVSRDVIITVAEGAGLLKQLPDPDGSTRSSRPR